MGYKKDIFGIFAYEFELLPKNLELSNLVGGSEPPSVDQWLHHFETAYKNHRDLFLGIYRYAFEQLSYDLLIILHRSVLQSVQDGVYIVESGLGLLSLELTISDVAELLLYRYADYRCARRFLRRQRLFADGGRGKTGHL